jgi:phosphoserine phosphatase
MTKKILYFDMDGVLIDIGSSWKYVHDYFQTTNDASVNAYLKGEISDEEFIRRDLALWKENGEYTTKDTIEQLFTDVLLMKGATTLFKFLHDHHIQTAIVSAGLDIIAKKIGDLLEIDFTLANGFIVDKNNRLTGEEKLAVRLIRKDQAVYGLIKSTNIALRNCAAVGNSCFDTPMFEITGLGIAFNPADDCVREVADIIIEEKNLELLIPIFRQYIK